MFRDNLRDGIDELLSLICSIVPNVGSEAEVFGKTGLAFSHYGFSPENNYNFLKVYPGRIWLYETADHDGYGAFESLAAHTNYDFRLYKNLRMMDLWALAEHELAENRPLLVATSEKTPKNGEIIKIEKEGKTRSWFVKNSSEKKNNITKYQVTFSILEAKKQAPLPNIVTIRQTPSALSNDAKFRLERDVLLWAIRHNKAKTELVYDYTCYFMPGLKAYNTLEQLCSHERIEESQIQNYLRDHMKRLAFRRKNGAEYLRNLADRCKINTSFQLQPDPLKEAALHYEQLALIIHQLLQDPVFKKDNWKTAILNAAKWDAKAIQCIENALK